MGNAPPQPGTTSTAMTKRLLLATLLGGLAISLPATAAPSLPAATMAAAPVDATVQPSRLRNLVPQPLMKGDREFGGNGPDVECTVTLKLSSDRRKVLADVWFKAKETQADWTTTEQTFPNLTVFTAPAGKTIDSIVDPTFSRVRFRSEPAGFQLLWPGEDILKFFSAVDKLVLDIIAAHGTLVGVDARDSEAYRRAERLFLDVSAGKRDFMFQGNHVHNRAPTSGPVALMSIVGDTGGPDISTDADGKDDTRIEAITFKKLRIRYR